MGGSQGKSSAPLPIPLTQVPWRKSPPSWDHQAVSDLIQQINSVKTTVKPNILTVGPVGAGKSSFITAILSVGRDMRYGAAQTGKSTSSYTLKLQRYTEHTLLENFNLFDCMGIEATEGQGVLLEDIALLLRGNMKNQYQFNPKSPMPTSHENYKGNPTKEDRIHCVVFVFNICTLEVVSQANIDEIKKLQQKIQQEGIPRVVVLTRCDLLCEEVKKNTKNLFSSVKVEKMVKLASEMFYIEKASIHPVVNYEDDADIRPEINIPLLLAMKQMKQYAIDQVQLISA